MVLCCVALRCVALRCVALRCVVCCVVSKDELSVITKITSRAESRLKGRRAQQVNYDSANIFTIRCH